MDLFSEFCRAPNRINDKLNVQETIQLTVELAWPLEGIRADGRDIKKKEQARFGARTTSCKFHDSTRTDAALEKLTK